MELCRATLSILNSSRSASCVTSGRALPRRHQQACHQRREGQTVYSQSCCDTAIPVRSKLAITILAKARYELEGEKHTIELVNDAAVYKPHMTGTLSPKRDRTIYKANRPNQTFPDEDTEKNRHCFHSLLVSSRSGHGQACSLFMKIARLPPCRNCRKREIVAASFSCPNHVRTKTPLCLQLCRGWGSDIVHKASVFTTLPEL